MAYEDWDENVIGAFGEVAVGCYLLSLEAEEVEFYPRNEPVKDIRAFIPKTGEWWVIQVKARLGENPPPLDTENRDELKKIAREEGGQAVFARVRLDDEIPRKPLKIELVDITGDVDVWAGGWPVDGESIFGPVRGTGR